MPKGQLSRVPWPGSSWMPFTFQPALRALQQSHKHSHSLQLATTAKLSDKDAVYMIESVVGGLHICKRVRSPTVFVGLQLAHEDRNDDRFAAFAACLQPSGVGLPSLFVGRLAIRGSLESGASARTIFTTRGHKSTNLTHV